MARRKKKHARKAHKLPAPAKRPKKLRFGKKTFGCSLRKVKAFGRRAKVARAFCAVIKKKK